MTFLIFRFGGRLTAKSGHGKCILAHSKVRMGCLVYAKTLRLLVCTILTNFFSRGVGNAFLFFKIQKMHADSSREKSSSKLHKQVNEEFLRMLDNPYELLNEQECISHG